jgi:hypothetical protein
MPQEALLADPSQVIEDPHTRRGPGEQIPGLT